MNRSQQVRVINEAFSSIPELFDGFWNVRDRLYDMNVAAEKRHRHGSTPPCGLSISNAAKLFTVHHLLDGWAQPDKWNVDAILSIRNEVLYAQAYAKKHHVDLKSWAEQWTKPFEQVDYAKLMEVRS